jgi:predicted peptidase
MLANDKPGMQMPHFLGEDHLQTYGFYAYLPPEYHEDGESFPLLVFLHGVGERGDSSKNPGILRNVLRNGPPKLIASDQWRINNKMIVISPQCHDTRWFPDQVHQFMLYILENYRVDHGAVFLTGLSMGGFGTLHYLENYSSHKVVSAAVTVCGGGNASGASNLNLPIWAFHGSADKVVPPIYSIEMINAINAANPEVKARLTIFPDVEHDSWTMTYDGSGMGKESRNYDPFDESIYDWMLCYRR